MYPKRGIIQVCKSPTHRCYRKWRSELPGWRCLMGQVSLFLASMALGNTLPRLENGSIMTVGPWKNGSKMGGSFIPGSSAQWLFWVIVICVTFSLLIMACIWGYQRVTNGRSWLMVVESGQSFEKHMWKIRRIKQTNQIPQPVLARLDRHEQ